MSSNHSPLKQATTYTFSYGSDVDSIDLNTLLVSQIHFSTVLNEIKNEVSGGADLSIRIRPLSKGSVPFDIMLNLSWLDHLFATGDILLKHAETIITVFIGLITLKEKLKGKKPLSIQIKEDKVIVSIDDNTTIEVDKAAYKIHESNAVVDQAIKKGFEAINKDEDVTSIKILDEKKKPLLEIPRSEFSNLIHSNETFEVLKQTVPVREETLTIFKVVFDKGYKWQFYQTNGRKISATIEDDIFMERVIAKGEPFSKGDTLIVEIEVAKVFDKTLDIYIEKDFKITKVIKHIPRTKFSQNNLFSDNDPNLI